MDTTKISNYLNGILFPEFTIALLQGDPTHNIFPRIEIITDDVTDEFVYANINSYWRGRDGVEPDPWATLSYEVSTGNYFYAFMEYEFPKNYSDGSGEPGGWEAGEYFGPFSDIRSLVISIKDAWKKIERELDQVET